MKPKILLFFTFAIALGLFIASCSISPTPQPTSTSTTGGGGTTTKYVYIYGKITNNYTPEWKVFAANISTKYYGTVNTSDGTFSIQVPENIGDVQVFAFKDTNNNNLWDIGEITVEGPQTNVTTNNISNIFISIPYFVSQTVTIYVSNNIYGLRVGVGLVNTTNNSFSVSPSTNATNFSYTLTLTTTSNSTNQYIIYIDLDNDNTIKTATLGPQIIPLIPLEPIVSGYYFGYTGDYFVYTGGNITNSIVLVPQLIKGSVTSPDLNVNKVMVSSEVAGIPNNILFSVTYQGISTVSSKSYEIKFYTISNTNISSPYVIAFNDIDNNNSFFLEDGGAKTITLTNNVASTNTVDFNIQKYEIYLEVSGVNGFNKIMDDKDRILLLLGIQTNIPTSPVTKTYYKDVSTSEDEDFRFILVFKDENNNGLPDVEPIMISGPDEDPYIYNMFIISNQTKITNIITLGTLNVGVTITNSGIYGYSNPKIYNESYYLGNQTFKVTSTNLNLNCYYITNYTYKEDSTNYSLTNIPFKLTLFDDQNNDGTKDWSEPSTNTVTINPSLGPTNVKF
jgi:hypothetical protein